MEQWTAGNFRKDPARAGKGGVALILTGVMDTSILLKPVVEWARKTRVRSN
jgi:hypothetical protein